MGFGNWLGKENGKTMLSEVFEDCSQREARCAVVTYCKIFGIKLDTEEWNELIEWIDEFYNSWFKDKEELDEYMRLDFDR